MSQNQHFFVQTSWSADEVGYYPMRQITALSIAQGLHSLILAVNEVEAVFEISKCHYDFPLWLIFLIGLCRYWSNMPVCESYFPD